MSSIVPLTAARMLGLPWLRIRRLGPADRAALAGHLLGLHEADRCARFDGSVSDAAVIANCHALDIGEGGPEIAIGAFDGDALVGAALACCGRDDAVEIAITVAPAHRRRRLAAHLVAQACETAARERQARQAVFVFNPSNAPVQGLIRHLGGVVQRAEGLGVVPIGADLSVFAVGRR